jgi:hypothetical protein
VGIGTYLHLCYALYGVWFRVLYCIVLYCIMLYCMVWYCVVLYCTVLCCIVLYFDELCCAVLCIVLYCIVLYCIELCCIVLYCIVQSLPPLVPLPSQFSSCPCPLLLTVSVPFSSPFRPLTLPCCPIFVSYPIPLCPFPLRFIPSPSLPSPSLSLSLSQPPLVPLFCSARSPNSAIESYSLDSLPLPLPLPLFQASSPSTCETTPRSPLTSRTDGGYTARSDGGRDRDLFPPLTGSPLKNVLQILEKPTTEYIPTLVTIATVGHDKVQYVHVRTYCCLQYIVSISFVDCLVRTVSYVTSCCAVRSCLIVRTPRNKVPSHLPSYMSLI